MTDGIGYGDQVGPLRPDWGDGWADLRCDVCGATWTGEIGEVCGYCLRWIELANEVQRRVLLHPDLPDDARRKRAQIAWVDRLAEAVRADIVTEREALTAIRREEGRHHVG